MAKYVAVRMGFYKNTRIRPGEEFEAPDNILKGVKEPKKHWFVKKADYVPVKPKPAGGPMTFSQLARAVPQAPIDLKQPNPKTVPDLLDLES